jgi:hypothetical protein
MGFFSPIHKQCLYLGGLVFYQARQMHQWGGHLRSQSSLGHGGLGLRIFKRFRILENVSQKDACNFLELLNVFEHAKKTKAKTTTTKRSIDFLMSLPTHNQHSPQVSFQSIVQCILHYYYIPITIYFCTCVFTFTSPLAFCVCVSTLSSPFAFAFMFLLFHHLVPFTFVFLDFHPNPLHFCLFAFSSLSTIKFKGTDVCDYAFRVLMFSKALVCVIKHLRWSILLQLVSCILIAQVLILGSNLKVMWFSSCLCFLGLW